MKQDITKMTPTWRQIMADAARSFSVNSFPNDCQTTPLPKVAPNFGKMGTDFGVKLHVVGFNLAGVTECKMGAWAMFHPKRYSMDYIFINWFLVLADDGLLMIVKCEIIEIIYE